MNRAELHTFFCTRIIYYCLCSLFRGDNIVGGEAVASSTRHVGPAIVGLDARSLPSRGMQAHLRAVETCLASHHGAEGSRIHQHSTIQRGGFLFNGGHNIQFIQYMRPV